MPFWHASCAWILLHGLGGRAQLTCQSSSSYSNILFPGSSQKTAVSWFIIYLSWTTSYVQHTVRIGISWWKIQILFCIIRQAPGYFSGPEPSPTTALACWGGSGLLPAACSSEHNRALHEMHYSLLAGMSNWCWVSCFWSRDIYISRLCSCKVTAFPGDLLPQHWWHYCSLCWTLGTFPVFQFQKPGRIRSLQLTSGCSHWSCIAYEITSLSSRSGLQWCSHSCWDRISHVLICLTSKCSHLLICPWTILTTGF